MGSCQRRCKCGPKKVNEAIAALKDVGGTAAIEAAQQAETSIKTVMDAVKKVRDAKTDADISTAETSVKDAIKAAKTQVKAAKTASQKRETAGPSRLSYDLGKSGYKDRKVITASGTIRPVTPAEQANLFWEVIEGLDDYLVNYYNWKISLRPRKGGAPILVSGYKSDLQPYIWGFRAGYVYYSIKMSDYRHKVYRFQPSANPTVNLVAEVASLSFTVDKHGNVLGKTNDGLKLYLVEGNFKESIALSLDGQSSLKDGYAFFSSLDEKIYLLEMKNGNVQLYVLGTEVKTLSENSNKDYVVNGNKFVTISKVGRVV